MFGCSEGPPLFHSAMNSQGSHSQLEAGVVPPHMQPELLSSGSVAISHLEQAISSEVLN